MKTLYVNKRQMQKCKMKERSDRNNNNIYEKLRIQVAMGRGIKIFKHDFDIIQK